MSKAKIIVCVCVCVCETFLSVNSVKAQWRTLDWKKDYWNSQNGMLFKQDKADHFIWMATTTIACENLFSQKNGWKYALALGLANEIKDAFVPWEKYGEIGGEGFSGKDMVANVVGVVVGHYLNKFNKKCHWTITIGWKTPNPKLF